MYLDPRAPVINPRSGFAANRYFPSWFIFLLSFRRNAYPKGPTLPTSVLALQPTGCFLLTGFCSLFSLYLALGFNAPTPVLDFQHVPTLQYTGRLLYTLAFDLVFTYVSMYLLFPSYHRSRLPHYVEAAESW